MLYGGEPGPDAPSAYVPLKPTPWYASDLRHLAKYWPIKLGVYAVVALFFWFRGIQGWWYWPIMLAWNSLKAFWHLFQ